jgi:arsenite-transporting ATPase
MDDIKQIYFITGKGGVGKTTVASAFAINLSKYRDVIYVSTDDIAKDQLTLLENNNIKILIMKSVNSTKEYLAKRIKSEIIASLIIKAPIFKTIFDMVPGFGQLIILGHITELAMSSSNKTVIFDAPSSGHMLSMFESLSNFKNIFGSGMLVRDIDTISKFISSKDKTKVIISTLPTMMALNEGIELKKELKNISPDQIEIILNNSISKMDLDQSNGLPTFIKSKIDMENTICDQYHEILKKKLAHIPELSSSKIINKLWPQTAQLA